MVGVGTNGDRGPECTRVHIITDSKAARDCTNKTWLAAPLYTAIKIENVSISPWKVTVTTQFPFAFTLKEPISQPAPAVSIGALSALDVRTRGKRVLLSVDDDVSGLS